MLDRRARYSRRYEKSPFFPAKNVSAVSSGTDWIYAFGDQQAKSKKYLPFNAVRITNNSSQNITFYPNQDSQGFLIVGGTIITLDSGSMPALRSFKITNEGASEISENEIEVLAYRQAENTNSIVQRIHRRIFG